MGSEYQSERMSIPLGTPSYKIKHDFKSDFTSATDIKEEDSKYYSEESWRIIQNWISEAKNVKKNLSGQEQEVNIHTTTNHDKRNEGN